MNQAYGYFSRVASRSNRARVYLTRHPREWGIRRWALTILVSLILIFLGVTYGVSRWYLAAHTDEPQTLGVSFVPAYARSLGLDAEETMDALIDDLGVRRFRLTSYWNSIEYERGTYDFRELDWQFAKAEAADANITLAIGLRQPRWPECHEPNWASDLPKNQWEPELLDFIGAVVARYKDSPSLESYQLENEFSLDNFGHCQDFDAARVQSEMALVKRLDPKRPVIISRSDNFPALLLSEPRPDIVGVSVYRRVWDGQFTNDYFNYPMPAWYYRATAGYQQLFTGRSSVLHEMQMEPWPANGQFIGDASLAEQDKSFPVEDFDNRIEFARNTGLRTIDLWGAEWWYWRMVEKDDPSFWNAAQEAFRD